MAATAAWHTRAPCPEEILANVLTTRALSCKSWCLLHDAWRCAERQCPESTRLPDRLESSKGARCTVLRHAAANSPRLFPHPPPPGALWDLPNRLEEAQKTRQNGKQRPNPTNRTLLGPPGEPAWNKPLEPLLRRCTRVGPARSRGGECKRVQLWLRLTKLVDCNAWQQQIICQHRLSRH